jgi:type I restriction enzyme S subunit
MIDRLRPYPEMKPTGLPWLDHVPAHWEVRRIKTLLKEVDKRSKFGEERLLSLRMRQGLVDHVDAGGKPIPPEALVGFKVIEPGQIVMNRMRAAYGLFGAASVRGLVSPDYAVYQPISAAYDRYLVEIFRLPSLAQVFRAESKGLGTGESGFLRLYTDRFGPIPISYPPLDEQKLIVRFLDWHGSQTAKLIRAKRKLVALLNEQKQAIIHRAVTRGLDPNAKLKPSGVPWLGEVPEGWEITPLKRVTAKRCDGPFGSGLKSSHYTSHGVLVIRLQNIGWGTFKTTEPAFISEEHYRSLGDHSVQADDLLIASLGDDRNPCGRACVAPSGMGEAMVKADCFRFRMKRDRADPHFLAASLSATAEASSAVLSAGATRQRVNLQSTAERSIALPPVSEQTRIVHRIVTATEEFQPLLESANREIALLQEFRARLIADVVTGKLDVRAAAAGLPDVGAGFKPAPTDADDDDLDEAVDDTENGEVAA